MYAGLSRLPCESFAMEIVLVISRCSVWCPLPSIKQTLPRLEMTLVCPGRPRPDVIVCTHSLGRIASITSIKSGRSSWSASGRASDARARVPIRRLPRISPAFHAHRATRRDLLDHRASLAHTLKSRASYLLPNTTRLTKTSTVRNTRECQPWRFIPASVSHKTVCCATRCKIVTRRVA